MASASSPHRRKARTGRRLSSAERKASFLDAARALIRERGLEALTMEGLAAHCGVNKALPYRHFANRDDVLVALYDQENNHFDVRLAKASARASGFEDKLRALILIWHGDVASRSGTPELMQARTVSGELEARRRVRMQIAVDYIADLIQESYKVRRADAKLAASVLLAGSQGLAAIWRTTGAEHKKLIESFVRMSVGAVAAIAEH
jgi:AcrR family transcriptional regulator